LGAIHCTGSALALHRAQDRLPEAAARLHELVRECVMETTLA
jgi:hypothetical protein